MEKWPIGVFASIDAGLGVKLEVARELGVPTIQLHAPHKAEPHAGEGRGVSEAAEGGRHHAHGRLRRLRRRELRRHSHRRPHASAWCRRRRAAARTQEMKEIADFAKLLG